jgi:hypothetical protein
MDFTCGSPLYPCEELCESIAVVLENLALRDLWIR